MLHKSQKVLGLLFKLICKLPKVASLSRSQSVSTVATPGCWESCEGGCTQADVGGRNGRGSYPGPGKAVSSLPSVPAECLSTQSPTPAGTSSPSYLGRSEPIPNMPNQNPQTHGHDSWSPNPGRDSVITSGFCDTREAMVFIKRLLWLPIA